MAQSVFVFDCPKCSLDIVLPPQNHLETLDGQTDPSKEIWPIRFLCQRCGQVSEVPKTAIHLRALGKPVRSQLVRYEFSNGQSDWLVRFDIYSTESDPQEIQYPTRARAIERVLIPSLLWRDEYGKIESINVCVDPLLRPGAVRLGLP